MESVKVNRARLEYEVKARRALGALALALMATLVSSGAALAASANSAATVTGSFSDSCREFEAHSSKDISHVEIHHADGQVVKDEDVGNSEFLTEGNVGDEIAIVIVKSGTTAQRFDCDTGSAPPDDNGDGFD
jgi:type 1 fimbria pilin